MAYILGTTTLLLVKSDERMGRFRDRFATVRQFADSNRLPQVALPLPLLSPRLSPFFNALPRPFSFPSIPWKDRCLPCHLLHVRRWIRGW